MTSAQRSLVAAAVIAALLGFAVGWFARVWSRPTVEERAQDAAETIKERYRELAH